MSGATQEGFLFFLEPTGEDQTEAGKTSTAAATTSSSHRLERRRKASELALRAIAGRDTAERRRGAVDWRERWCSLRGDVLHVYDDRLASLATPCGPAPRQVLLSDYQHLQTTGSFDPRNQGVWELTLSRQAPMTASARTLPRSTTSGSISSFFDRLGSSSSNLSGLATAKTGTEEATRWHKLTHRPRRLYQLMSSSNSSSNSNNTISNDGSNTGTRSRTVSSSSSTMTIGSSAQDHGQAAAMSTKDADAAPLVLRVSDAQAMVLWSEAIAAVLRDAQSAESPSDLAVALGPRHRQRPSLSVFVDERPPRDDDPVLTAGAASRKRRGDPIASGLVRQSAASPPPSSSSPLPPPSSFQMTSKAKSSAVVVSDIMTKSRSKSRSRSRPVTAQGLLDQHRLSTASTASPPASTRRASLSSTLSRPSTASGRLSTEDSARKRDSLRSIRSSSSSTSPRVLLSLFGPVSSETDQGDARLTSCTAEEPLHGLSTPSEGLGLDLGPRPSPISAYDQFCTSHFSSPPDAIVVAAGDEDREEEEILHSPASTTAPAAMPRSQSLLNLAQRASKATRSVLSPSAAAYNLRKSVSFQKPAVLDRQDNENGRTPACSSVDSFELVHASPSLPAISLADSPSSIGSHGSSVVLASLSPAPRTPSPSFAIISSSSSISSSTNAGPANGNAGKKTHWTLPSSSTSKRARLTATAKRLASPRSSPLSFSSTTLSSSSADGHDTGAGAGVGAGAGADADADADAGAGATARNNSLPTNGIHCGSSTATFSSSSVSSCSSPPSTPVVAEMPRAAAPLPMLVQRILPPEEIISTLDRIRKLELEEAASVDDDAAAAAAADGGSLAIAGNAGRSTPVLDHHHHLRALSTSISLAEVCEQKRKPDGLHPQYNHHQQHHHQHRPGSAQRPRTMRPATSADQLSLSPAPRAKRQQSRLFRVHSDGDGDGNGEGTDDGNRNDATAVHVDLRSGAAMSTEATSQQLPSTPRSSNKRGSAAEGTARPRRETMKGMSASANADENAGDQHETPGRTGSKRSAMGDRTNASLPMSWSTSTVTPKQQRQRTRSISGAFSTP